MFGWDTTFEDAPQGHRDMSVSGAAARAVSGHGLISGTKIASALGWRAIDAIGIGDKVLTFDHGMQVVTDVQRTVFRSNIDATQAAVPPVLVPVGALGNRVPLTLLPDQPVMVESDAASDARGDPFAIVPAHSLVGYRDISAIQGAREFEVMTLYFAHPQVIYAEAGTLVYCPGAPVDLLDVLGSAPHSYDVLSAHEAAMLVECMHYEDLSAAYRPAGYEAANAA